MYIAYDIKNGTEYAKLYISKRKGKTITKEYINLGRVLDKENGIYQNRERGVFSYNLENNTYASPPASFVFEAGYLRREKLLVDFGDTFLLSNFIRNSGLMTAIDAVGYGNRDTLYAMICYYVLCSSANCHANDWLEGNYAGILYPKANLSSQRISDFLAAIGEESVQRNFFREYLSSMGGFGNDANILIDSTGLSNSIRFPLTAISNHNGEINNEVRLIYVTEQKTGLPIYFRYCPGNVIDASTLIRTIGELKANGVNTKFAVLDAGYYDDENISALYEEKISFVSRFRENRKLYKELVAEHIPSIEQRENLVSYNGRYVYIKCAECRLVDGHSAYAYIGLDIDRKHSESRKLFAKAKAGDMTNSEVFDQISRQGIFILVSSRRIAKDKILPIYYTRQQIEQIFDIGKNYADLIPIRIQKEGTFRGHLLLTFIATVIIKKIQDKLKNSAYNPISLFINMRNQKCKVYDNRIITQEAFKKANDCYKLFGIKCPIEIIR